MRRKKRKYGNQFSAYIKDIPRRFKAETPKVFIWIRNICALISTVATAVNSKLIISGVTVPSWFTENIWYFIALPAVIAFFVQTKEKKDDENKI